MAQDKNNNNSSKPTSTPRGESWHGRITQDSISEKQIVGNESRGEKLGTNIMQSCSTPTRPIKNGDNNKK